MSGQLIGHRYRVLRKIGEGGMAVVHLAIDEKLGRDVAIKILRERYENHDEIRIRFQHEARAISSFDHPNILKVYDFSGEESRQLWIVTELIHGRNLAQILETTPSGWLHPVIAASIVREICRALSSAHEHGVIHRDVKPENVMITHHGSVKLMDFGIAKIQRITSMTQTGMFMGSPSYMSPEQVRGRDVDPRSDIYSLGVLFYELITGKLPFTGSSTADIAMRILNGDFAHPRFIMAGIPDSIDQCIVQCMSLHSENRPQSIEAVGETIDHLLESFGMDSSLKELERCFKDPKAYGDRLARILRVSEAKQEATVLIQNPQANPVAKWNAEAIKSPIPRPDISGEHLPSGSQRRDHLLPPRAVPHFTKRQLTAEAISAHLPERRHQQRATEPTRLASGSKFGQYNNKAVIAPVAAPRQEPIRHVQKINPHPNPQMLRNQVPQIRRDIRPASRIVPATPKRAPRNFGYHAQDTYYPSRGSGAFSKLVIAILLLSSAAIIWMGNNRNTTIKSRQTISATTKQKKIKIERKEPETLPVVEKSPTTVQAQTTPTELAEKENVITKSNINNDLLPKFAQKQRAIKESQTNQNKKRLAATNTNVETNKDSKTRSSTQDSPTKILLESKQKSNKQEQTGRPIATITTNGKPSQTIPGAKISTSIQEIDNSLEDSVVSASPKSVNKSTDTAMTSAQDLKKQVQKVQISVSSTPAAELFINGRRQGTTNDGGSSSHWIDLENGNHKIELRRAGFTARKETIFVSTDLKQRFGPYSLTRAETVGAQRGGYKLTISTNLPPVDVSIINIESNAKQTINLTQPSKTISLDQGIYEVTMSRKGDVRKRRLDFSGSTQQLTFSVEFRETGQQE
jgi:serine/threonine protein kinase